MLQHQDSGAFASDLHLDILNAVEGAYQAVVGLAGQLAIEGAILTYTEPGEKVSDANCAEATHRAWYRTGRWVEDAQRESMRWIGLADTGLNGTDAERAAVTFAIEQAQAMLAVVAMALNPGNVRIVDESCMRVVRSAERLLGQLHGEVAGAWERASGRAA